MGVRAVTPHPPGTDGDADRALAAAARAIEEEYERRTPRSRALHERARASLPGGDTRDGTVFRPYPTYVERAEGVHLYDVDGNELLDLTNNASSLIHGHAHPAIVRAIAEQAARGTAWNAPSEPQLRLAETLRERVPSLERVRFCNSGTEANMMAIKAARAFTGRDRILKMDGAYHGTYEGTELDATEDASPTGAAPRLAPVSRGIPRNETDNVLVAPFDDAAAAERLIATYRDELAAAVVTPVFTRRGLTPPSSGYLRSLREATRRHAVLLVFDEVISFRLARGGAQERFGVAPDLTALGKIVGGGLPVGAFGGRADVMELFAPERPAIHHAGTFNGNPLTMAAGIATLELLTPDAFARLERLAERLRTRVERVADEAGVPLRIVVVGSLASFGFAAGTAGAQLTELQRLLHLAMLNRGVRSGGLIAIPTVMSGGAIDRFALALGEALRELRPALEAVGIATGPAALATGPRDRR